MGTVLAVVSLSTVTVLLPFMLQAHLKTTTLDFMFLVILMITLIFALTEKAAIHPPRILGFINVITVVLNIGQLKAMQLEKMK